MDQHRRSKLLTNNSVRIAYGMALALQGMQEGLSMKINHLIKRSLGTGFVLSVLLGIGIFSTVNTQAQYRYDPRYQQDRDNRDRDNRDRDYRDRDYQRHGRSWTVIGTMVDHNS